MKNVKIQDSCNNYWMVGKKINFHTANPDKMTLRWNYEGVVKYVDLIGFKVDIYNMDKEIIMKDVFYPWLTITHLESIK